MMNEEMLLNEERIGPDTFDDEAGNLYKDLWIADNRIKASFDVENSHGGVKKGSITFREPFVSGEATVMGYFIETVDDSGSYVGRTVRTLDDVARLLNNNELPKILKDERGVYFEFTKGMYQAPNTGITRLGITYRPANGWEYHFVNHSGGVLDSVHLPIDCDGNQFDIEVLILTSGKHLAYGVYKRDLPMVQPDTYTQYLFNGKGLYEMKLHNLENLEISKVQGSAQGDIQSVWLRLMK